MTTIETNELGAIVKSWRPGSLLRDASVGNNLPGWYMVVQTAVTFISLFACAIGARKILDHLLAPIGLPPSFFLGFLVFTILFAIPMVCLHRIGQFLVDRRELAVYENGVRWAKSVILFNQIESLSKGTQTFRETHFPILNVLMKASLRHGEDIKKAEELERASTLAFRLKNGQITQWRNLSRCFNSDTLNEFFEETVSRIGD